MEKDIQKEIYLVKLITSIVKLLYKEDHYGLLQHQNLMTDEYSSSLLYTLLCKGGVMYIVEFLRIFLRCQSLKGRRIKGANIFPFYLQVKENERSKQNQK